MKSLDKNRVGSPYSPEEYRISRVFDYGAFMDFVLLEKIYGIDIPDEVWNSQPFIELLKEVIYHGVLMNDIVSLSKEVSNEETRNWIIIRYLTTCEILYHLNILKISNLRAELRNFIWNRASSNSFIGIFC